MQQETDRKTYLVELQDLLDCMPHGLTRDGVLEFGCNLIMTIDSLKTELAQLKSEITSLLDELDSVKFRMQV